MKKLILFLTLITSPAHAFSVKHEFNVFVGAFNASQTEFSYGLDKKSYFVKSDVKTAGIFGTLYPFEANYLTTGNIKNGRLETTGYKYKSKSLFKRRTKELVYDKTGTPVYQITSKNDKESKKEIRREAKNQGTTDLQTVFAEMTKQYNETKLCDSKMEVFDGKRRFDVIFKDEGKEELIKDKRQVYDGEARKCSMYIDKLDNAGDDLLWQTASDRPVYFWILEDKKTKYPFIAKVEVGGTPLGRMLVYTRKITVND